MITVWKFPITPSQGKQSIKMPVAAKILSVHTQYNDKKFIPMMWAMVDTDNLREVRTFELFYTGAPINDTEHKKVHFISTFQIEDLIYHLFEVKKG